MTVHNAVANRPPPRTATPAAARTQQPPPPPGIAYGQRPECDSFAPAGPRRPEPMATIMPITTPDSAKATSVLRYEARQVRMELVGAAMRGDRGTVMELGQRLGQLKEALSARGAAMFPSSELSLSQYCDSFDGLSDDQMLGERSDQLQIMLVGEIQLDRSAVANGRERFEAVQTEVDRRGGCGLSGLDVVFAGWGDAQLTSAVTGMIDIAAGGGTQPQNGYDVVGGKPPGGASNVHAAVPVGQASGPQQQGGGFDLGSMLGNLFGGIFGGGQAGQGGQGGPNVGDIVMGILDPAGLFKGLMGGGKAQGQQGGQPDAGGIDKIFNAAGTGIIEMATRGIGDLFKNLFK